MLCVNIRLPGKHHSTVHLRALNPINFNFQIRVKPISE